MLPGLTFGHYKVRIKESGAIQGKKECPILDFSVVATKKGTFKSPSTTVGQLNQLWSKGVPTSYPVAQSAGAVEYTNFITAER